jgi:monovalent cation/hydrogen antiporter
MQHAFIEYIALILIILALVMLSNKLKVSYPIILVLGGLLLSFTSPFSHVTIDPELIFFIFLPPLLYEAAWATSWKEFYKWRRVIMSFAFPIVIITSCAVAIFANALIPGFTLALGFLLGGIVSPPDAISATSIMKNVNAPRDLVNIAEGESLLNDASSLIVFRFAMAAVITNQFVFAEAAGDFFLVIIMGTLIGLAIGLIFYAIHRWMPTTPSIDIVLSFITPYSMYYFAELWHFSGVLAVVSGGLLLSNQRHKMLSHLSRIQGTNVWSTVGFVLNGLIFLLIGLQLPNIVDELEDISLSTAIWYGLLISLLLIVVRVLCTLGASVFTVFISRFITVADANPGWRGPLILGFAGMRGVVSLAMALSIPVMIAGDRPFPQRNLILFITFIVILVTLVFQGLTLPWLIRKIQPEDRSRKITPGQQEAIIMKKMAEASLNLLKSKYGDNEIANELIRNTQLRLNTELTHFTQSIGNEMALDEKNPMIEHQLISLELLEEQRRILYLVNHKMEFDEELVRKYLALLDLEETKLREKLPEHYR